MVKLRMKVKNEVLLLKKALENGEISEKTSDTIIALCKYYFSQKMNKRQVKDNIMNFMVKNYINFNAINWSITLDKWINSIQKTKNYELIHLDSVEISKSELENIKKLADEKLEHVLFVMLVHAKIWNALKPENDNWVNSTTNSIFKDADLSSRKILQKEKMIAKIIFSDLKLVTITKRVNNTNLRIEFIESDPKEEDTEISISNFESFIDEYKLWRNKGSIIKCKKCSVLIKKDGKTQYCPACKVNRQKEWQKESMQKKRQKEKCEVFNSDKTC